MEKIKINFEVSESYYFTDKFQYKWVKKNKNGNYILNLLKKVNYEQQSNEPIKNWSRHPGNLTDQSFQ